MLCQLQLRAFVFNKVLHPLVRVSEPELVNCEIYLFIWIVRYIYLYDLPIQGSFSNWYSVQCNIEGFSFFWINNLFLWHYSLASLLTINQLVGLRLNLFMTRQGWAKPDYPKMCFVYGLVLSKAKWTDTIRIYNLNNNGEAKSRTIKIGFGFRNALSIDWKLENSNERKDYKYSFQS